MRTLEYYGIDERQEVVVLGRVTLDQALVIAAERTRRGFEHFETAEAAITATMYGFNADPGCFIEIAGNGAGGISFRFEISRGHWLRRILGGTKQILEELPSEQQLIERVREFFARDPDDYLHWLRERSTHR